MRRPGLALSAIALLLVTSLDGAVRAAPAPAPATATRGVDLLVVSEKVLVPGSRAAIRVTTRGPISMTESRPLSGVTVTLSLSGRGKETQLFSGRTDGRGNVDVGFKVPEWEAGSYQMAIRASGQTGEATTQQTVELKRTARVLLVTDKPIYQPRQSIRMRALLLGTHDLRPLSGVALRFEVQDPKGNKVFRKEVAANRFGIASATFQLADEINLGNYQVEVAPEKRDLAETATRTVVVKKYVLPKFKVAVETDRAFYLPKQTLKGTIRSDYFFGKPVAGGKVTAVASTFDGVSFKTFATLEGQTGKDGTWSFESNLPDYFVGQPLLKGDALVKLEVKVKDTANHTEAGVRSVPVAAAPIRVAALPEGGRLVLGVENQVYVVATYPDGGPAVATVTAEVAGKTIATVQTDASGLGFFSVTPKGKELRLGDWKSRTRLGQSQSYQAKALDLKLTVRDSKGATATVAKTLSGDPEEDQVLLRTDKAIYKAGDLLTANVLVAGGGPDSIYLDVIKNHQTLLTKVLFLERGKGTLKLPLGPDLFGSIEVHAYRIQPNGEIQRDARVLYVQPPSELAIEVGPDKKVYRPGERAVIRFRVTDAGGKPQAAALGVVVVDEAVYALQEIQPGLEKVFFTLEKEIATPRYEIEFTPRGGLPEMVKPRDLDPRQQRAAKALLSGVKPVATPSLWENPVAVRQQKAENNHWTIRSAIYSALSDPKLGIVVRTGSTRWSYAPNLLQKLVKAGRLSAENAKDPLGLPYTVQRFEKQWPDLRAQTLVGGQELSRLWSVRSYVQMELYRRTENLTKLKGKSIASHLQRAFAAAMKQAAYYSKDIFGKPYTYAALSSLPGFRVEDFVSEIHTQRLYSIYSGLRGYASRLQQKNPKVYDSKRSAWVLPPNAVAKAIREKLIDRRYATDIWGHPFVLRPRAKEQTGAYYDQQFRFYDLVSLGADGQLGSEDDLVYPRPKGQENAYQVLASALGLGNVGGGGPGWGRWRGGRGGGGGRGVLARPRAQGPMRKMARAENREDGADDVAFEAPEATKSAPADMTMSGGGGRTVAPSGASTPAAPKRREVRVRESFPETLLFLPSLITDEKGEAKLELAMADSITTWRMTASANSATGSLGGTTQSLRVFQDFFVDIDLPVALTQNDEVSIPIVVFNYLKSAQRVRLELKNERWFELKGSAAQELSLAPQEVAATYYRIRVRDLGRRTLEVRADGSSMSDAIRREIEVLPDGKEQNIVANGRVEASIDKTISVPQTAVPGASKILVRLYPGVFSQIIEGMDSMLRLPGG